MRESDIRATIAAASARLDHVVVRDGRRVSPLAAAALVLGAGLAVAACTVAVYDAPCPDDGCGYPGGSGGAGGDGGAGGVGGN